MRLSWTPVNRLAMEARRRDGVVTLLTATWFDEVDRSTPTAREAP